MPRSSELHVVREFKPEPLDYGRKIFKQDQLLPEEVTKEVRYLRQIKNYLEDKDHSTKSEVVQLSKDIAAYERELQEVLQSGSARDEMIKELDAIKTRFRKEHYDLFKLFIDTNMREVDPRHFVNYDVTEQGWLRIAPPKVGGDAKSLSDAKMNSINITNCTLIGSSKGKIQEIDLGGSRFLKEDIDAIAHTIRASKSVAWKVDLGSPDVGVGDEGLATMKGDSEWRNARGRDGRNELKLIFHGSSKKHGVE